MKTLFDLIPNAIEENIVRDLVNLHIECLVSFLVPLEHHEGKYRLLGSGFFVYSPDPSEAVIMSARHVLEEFDYKNGRITIGTTVITPGDVGMQSLSPDVDLASWRIPADLLISSGITEVPTLPFWIPENADEIFEPLDSFVIAGYPGSKNSHLDFREGNAPDRAIVGMALHGSSYEQALGIRKFHYKGKVKAESWRSDMTTAPRLNGMSGSPCFRIVIHRTSGHIGIILAGVFYAWDKRKSHLFAAVYGDPWK